MLQKEENEVLIALNNFTSISLFYDTILLIHLKMLYIL